MDLREISALCSTRHPRLIQILLLECIDLIHYFFREYVDYEKIIPDFKQLRKFCSFSKMGLYKSSTPDLFALDFI